MTDTTTPQADKPASPVHDELWRHLDWSFWGTGMADEFREPLAEAMLAGITAEQREQANALITRWRDHREFVGRDKYEAQKAEIEKLRAELEQARASAFNEAIDRFKTLANLAPDSQRAPGINFAIGALMAMRDGAGQAAASTAVEG